MPSTKLILLAALLLGWLLRVSGTTWHVAENGSDDNDGLSWRTALANPQSAIDRAHSGDCVLIGTGKYYATHILETDSDSVYASSFVLKEGVSLYGGYSPELARRPQQGDYAWDFGGGTILTVQDACPGTVLLNEHPFVAETVVDGIILEGGAALGASGKGGGARLHGNVELRNSIVRGNVACNGGGVFLDGGARLDSCLVTGNCVMEEGWGGKGGGIYAGADAAISNCLITANGNGVQRGGGIYGAGKSEVSFSTVTGNGAMRAGSGICLESGDSSVAGTVVWGNAGTALQFIAAGAVRHCAIEGAQPNETCIPLLKDNCGMHGVSCNDNWAGGYYPCFISPEDSDWRLGAGSYMINRGGECRLANDACGNPRALCGIADIGAFETRFKGNLALDFELEMPCIYGNASKVIPITGVLTPKEIGIEFEDPSHVGQWRDKDGVWISCWKAAGTACPTMKVTPLDTSQWSPFALTRKLQVLRRTIYILADDKECTCLETMPELTYHFIAGSLAPGDRVIGELDCDASSALDSPWPIVRGSLAIDDGANGLNYILTFLDGEVLCHKAQADVAIRTNELAYTGKPQGPIVTTRPEGLNYTCEYRDSAGNPLGGPPSQPGEYFVAIAIDDEHYNGSCTLRFSIKGR